MDGYLRLSRRWLLTVVALLAWPPLSPAAQAPQPAEPGVPAEWWATVQEQIEEAEYAITWQDRTYLPDLAAAYQAPNRAENLRTYFEPGGITVLARTWPEEVSEPPWRWQLHLATWGRGEMVAGVPPASLEVLGNRIDYRRGSLVEWYSNDRQGLDHGFRLEGPPGPAGEAGAPLALELAIGGDLALQGGEGQGAAFLDAAGEVVLRYGSLRARDAEGRKLPLRLSASSTSLFLLVDDTGASYPIEIVARLTGLPPAGNWSLTWGSPATQFGWSVATAGDVNGDGYSDVVIGAPRFDGGLADEGKAFVYLGHPLGLAYDPVWYKESDQAGAQFGYAVGSAGDVNADSRADVIVGAPLYDHPDGAVPGTNEGGAWVYHGNGTGVNWVPDFFAQANQAGAQMGYAVATAGDVNNDGFADMIVGGPYYDDPWGDEGAAWVWHGSSLGLNGGENGTPDNAQWHARANENGAMLGISVSTAGDVNGDTFADVIVGAYQYGALEQGVAAVWHGSAEGVNGGAEGIPIVGNAGWLATGAPDGAHLGRSVSTAGDVNSDGYADVIVGAPHYSNYEGNEGAIYLYLGSGDGLGWAAAQQKESNAEDAWLGQSVALAGDVNGDGYADVIAGAPLLTVDLTEQGAAFLWYGSASGLGTHDNWSAQGEGAMAWYGNSVGTAGDVNGDGYSDVIVGAPGEASAPGTAYVYHGGPDMPGATANWAKRGNREGLYFGWSVGTAGDVNGDGYADIIVGAPLWDEGQTNEGGAWIYHGAPGGLLSTPPWHKESDVTNAQFGWSVGTAGDVDGDGYSDVIVGAPTYSSPQTAEGGAWVYHGSASGADLVPRWNKASDQEGAQFGYAVATAGDVNNDGYADVVVGAPYTDHGQTDEGVAWLYLGSATGLRQVPARHLESDHAGAQLGFAVASAGDVNADGFSDVLAGSPFWEDDVDAPNEGRAWLYLGCAYGLPLTAGWHAESNTAGARLGHALASAGDVNGDGFSDVVVGAPYWADGGASGEGRVWVFYGSARGLTSTGAWTRESGQSDAYYGFSVATAGDVNGDGYADILIGAPSMTGPDGPGSEGVVRLYLGTASGVSSSYAWTGQGRSVDSWFGNAVGSAGDVNGDGFADLVIGARAQEDTVENEGMVLVHYGNGRSGAALALRPLNDAGRVVHTLGRTDGDAFRLAMIRRSPFGRGRTIFEVEVKPLGLRLNGTGTFFPGGMWSNPEQSTGTSLYSGDLRFGTAYHWRMRTRYHPGTTPWMPASRWVTVPWNGWNEEDLSTPGSRPFLPLVGRGFVE